MPSPQPAIFAEGTRCHFAFSKTLPIFERLLANMYGVADGVRERLTEVSSPVSGAFCFAPPVLVLDRIAR